DRRIERPGRKLGGRNRHAFDAEAAASGEPELPARHDREAVRPGWNREPRRSRPDSLLARPDPHVKVPRRSQRRGTGAHKECDGERDEVEAATRGLMAWAKGVESRRTRTC